MATVLNVNTKTNETPLYTSATAWSGLLVLYLGLMSMGAMFHLIPPILSRVIADQGISHSQGGMLMSLFALPGIVLSLAGGWLVDRFGARLMSALGILIMGIATVALSRGDTFSLILFARLATGVGAVVAVVAMQRMVTRLFQGRSLGLPTGVSGSAVPVGIIIIYTMAGPLAESQGWRAVPWRAGLVCIVVSLIFFLAGRTLFKPAPLHDTAESNSPKLDPSAGLRLIWIAGLIWFFINGAMTAFLTFAPDHYLELGFGSQERGLFTSIPMWCSAFLGPVIGLLADKYGGKPVFIASGMGLLTLCMALVTNTDVPPLLVGFGLGASLALVVTPLLSLPGELLPPSHHGRGFGILSTCANAGIFLVPPLAGKLRDFSGGYFLPFILLAGLALVGIVVAIVLHRQSFFQNNRKLLREK